MRKLQILLLVIICIAIIAAVSKPSDEKCKEAVKEKLTSIMTEETGGMYSKFASNITNLMVAKGVSVEDYFVFKNIKFTYDGKSKSLGWGAFGMVNIKD